MKGRESGMPDEEYWESFFDAEGVVDTLVTPAVDWGDVAELGSGYGTFTLAAARKVMGIVHGFDIEAELVALAAEKCKRLGLQNVRLEKRDFVEHGTGLADGSVVHVMLYNLLHIEQPVALLREAARILQPGGTASVIHWRRDIATPRGPSLAIRPDPQQCLAWAHAAGFARQRPVDISAYCPYHFGLLLDKAGRTD